MKYKCMSVCKAKCVVNLNHSNGKPKGCLYNLVDINTSWQKLKKPSITALINGLRSDVETLNFRLKR